MAKTTWIPPRFKNQLHCGIVAGGRGMESSVAARAGSHYGGPKLSRQNQKPHGKTKNLTAKTKTSRQNQKPHGKNKIPHGKTENLTAKTKTSRQNQKPHGKNKIPHDKTKNLTAKPKTSRQNQILHSKNQIPHGKSKYPLQNQSYFAFAVKYLILS